MYIRNRHWKHCGLGTSFTLRNIDWGFETQIGYWKHKLYIGNIRFQTKVMFPIAILCFKSLIFVSKIKFCFFKDTLTVLKFPAISVFLLKRIFF